MAKMKILFCDFAEEWHAKIINRVVDEIKADSVVLISRYKHTIERADVEYCWINNEDLNYHHYDNYKKINLPPIDSMLIESMMWCEKLYLPMLDRSELVMSEKISYRKRREYYYTELRLFLGLLKNVDACLFSNIPHVGFDFILYGLCRALKIPYIIQFFCPIIPRQSATIFFMKDIFNPIPQLSKIDYSQVEDVVLSSRMQAYFDYYGRKKEEIVKVLHYSDFDLNRKKSSLANIINVVIERQKNGLLWATIHRRIVNIIQDNKINRLYKEKCYKPVHEKYIYLPLHYQPECTSLPMGGYYFDQLLVVQQLSSCIPDDVKLYVKPHPSRSWFADEDFYEEILACKNVCLISPNVDSYDLIDNAIAVASLTGTSIIEALIRGKPVFMFGYYIWQYAPGVFHCKTCMDVKKAMDIVCCEENIFSVQQLRKFFAELDKYVFTGSSVAMIQRMCHLSQDECTNAIVNGYSKFLSQIKRS